ncbi:MAG: 3-hydroxyacyl-[acyl-carrier-protein] dehydratase FabZ [Limosilactobacillus fermentum]|jgi:3-hydroxyacyl-[acyl-carrier-protein] dehydratase
MSKVMLDSTAIQKIIPHRYPMLLIDRVEELVPGEMAVAKRNVTINEAVFNGHFPNNPVLPGALIVESLAQTGAVASYPKRISRARRPTSAGSNPLNFGRWYAPAIL